MSNFTSFGDDGYYLYAGTPEEAVWTGQGYGNHMRFPTPPFMWTAKIEPLYELEPHDPPTLSTWPVEFSMDATIRGVIPIPDTSYVLIKTDTEVWVWHPTTQTIKTFWFCVDEWSVAKPHYSVVIGDFLFVIVLYDEGTWIKRYRWMTGEEEAGPWMRWAEKMEITENPEVLRVTREQGERMFGDHRCYTDTVLMCTKTGRILEKVWGPFMDDRFGGQPEEVRPGWTLEHDVMEVISDVGPDEKPYTSTLTHPLSRCEFTYQTQNLDHSTMVGYAGPWVMRLDAHRRQVYLYYVGSNPTQPWELVGVWNKASLGKRGWREVRLLPLVLSSSPPFDLEALPRDVWDLVWHYSVTRLLLWVDHQLVWLTIS